MKILKSPASTKDSIFEISIYFSYEKFLQNKIQFSNRVVNIEVERKICEREKNGTLWTISKRKFHCAILNQLYISTLLHSFECYNLLSIPFLFQR